MQVTESAVALMVADVDASVGFFTEHFGYRVLMSADGFASIGRDDAAIGIVLLRTGLEVMPAADRDRHADGVTVAFVVDDLEGELARLEREGVTITLPLHTEEWGERLFQVKDPNGVSVELVDWVTQN
ncbi:MAG TPA: VOC family protein [Pseudonocardiaceae bacterium]|jgi:catechol 2,3-dioxygenase-like lactoylglutathione lyase family enzyme